MKYIFLIFLATNAAAMDKVCLYMLRDYKQGKQADAVINPLRVALADRVNIAIAGNKVNAYDREGPFFGLTTPLFDAATNDEFVELTQGLLRHGANPNRGTGVPKSASRLSRKFVTHHFPLAHAIHCGSFRTAALLVNAGSNQGQLDKAMDALMEKVLWNEGDNSEFEAQKYLFHLLLAKGADVNKPNRYRHTPLITLMDNRCDFDESIVHIPMEYRLYFAKELLDHGALAIMPDTLFSAAEIARGNKFFELAQMIEDATRK